PPPKAPAPEPPPAPVPAPSAPPAIQTIDSTVLSAAMGDPLGPIQGNPQGFSGTPVYVGQNFHRDQFDAGTYTFWSRATTWDPDMAGSRTELQRTTLTIRETWAGSGY